MALWQEIVLVVFSCLALIIALYCLLFTVPVKRFWERVDSLGGGVKGVESYVDGLYEDVSGKLTAMESGVRQQLSQAQERSQEAVERVARDSRQAKRDLERMRADLHSLQAELRAAANQTGKLTRNVETIADRLQQFQSDFDQLEVKLRESVRVLVAESFKGVESTILSALEAVQEEMLAEVPSREGPGPGRPFAPRKRPAPSAPDGAGSSRHQHIIEPLFAGLDAFLNAQEDRGPKHPVQEPERTAGERDDGEQHEEQ